MILINGQIITGDEQQPLGEAVSIAEGRIVAVGKKKAILASKGKRTKLIDLGGRTVMAGITDTHDHPFEIPFGTEAITAKPPMADPALSELLAAVAEAVKMAPEGGWIQAKAGVSVMSDTKATLAALEKVSQNHPIAIHAWWGHGVILNQQGLNRLGLSNQTPDPIGGWLIRGSDGQLTGRLDEYACFAAVRKLTSEVPLTNRVEALRHYAEQRLKQGVTSVHMMATGQSLDKTIEVVVAAKLPLRLRVIQFPLPGQDLDPVAIADRTITPLAQLAGVKYVIDGTPIEQGAFRTKDYPNRPGWRGHLILRKALSMRP